jgi:O-antigen ligase
LFYLFVVGAAVLSSFVFLLRPFVNLRVTIFFLVSANTSILGTGPSAAIAALLIGNCFVGAVLASGLKLPFQRSSMRLPLLLCAVAVLGAVYGIARGNSVSLVLGDFYQIIEFASLFVLARTLVKTEQQFRTMANVLIGSIIATSVLQMIDLLMEASYLPHLERSDDADLLRIINMNAPIAFVALLAALPVARTKWWLLAGLAFLEINLILSFTRGLWVATLASTIALLVLLSHSRAAILKFGFAAGVLAIAFVYAFGLGSVAGNRIGYSLQQLRSTPLERQVGTAPPPEAHFPGASPQETQVPGPFAPEKQVLSARRRLEYILILPQVLKRPFTGEGLGATYRIHGDAIKDGPKGEIIENHYIHDLYLQVAFRLGIPALLIFLALLWTYFRRSIGNLRTFKLSAENSALMAGLIAAMFGEVLLSLTSPTFLNHPTAGVIGCIMAMTTVALRQSAQQPARIDAGYALNKAQP